MPRARSTYRAAPPRADARRSPVAWFAAAAVVLAAVVAVAYMVLGSAARPGESSTGRPSSAVHLVAYQGAEVIGGQRLDLASVVGRGTPVVLNFFAGLCPPCRAEMPGFERVWERHQGEIILLGADIGPFVRLGSHADAERLLADLGITYPAAYVEDNPVAELRIAGMPTTIIYDASGEVVAHHTGVLTEDQLEQAIQALVSASPRAEAAP